ncbi:MAG: NADH:ubiquinone oxidoreductase subunit NDUFA12 [Novosphingobium sp.]
MLLLIFTWWNGATAGTLWTTRRHGQFVGEDSLGNRYYRRPGKDPTLGIERRWVIYNGEADGSAVPAGWKGWLTHTVDVPPSEETYKPHEWERPHQPNPTGTALAHRPSGSILRSGERPPATGDYEAWSPR